MSATIDNWIAMQKRVVRDDGECTATIRLVGYDGTVWGTWPLFMDDVAAAIREHIKGVQEELPTQNYSAKLIALNADGQQVSFLPHTLHGASSAASEASKNERGFAAATAAQLMNSETVQNQLRQENERLHTRYLQAMDSAFTMQAKVLEFMREDLEVKQQLEEHATRMEILVGIGKQLEPLAAIGASIAAETLAERAKEAKEKRARQRARARAREDEDEQEQDRAGAQDRAGRQPPADSARAEADISSDEGPGNGKGQQPEPTDDRESAAAQRRRPRAPTTETTNEEN